MFKDGAYAKRPNGTSIMIENTQVYCVESWFRLDIDDP